MTALPELRARSAFSFLEGASLPETLIEQAAKLEIPAVALLDRDAVSGAVRFHKEAKKRGVRAWIGAEVTAEEGFRYPLIAATREGYRNLCRLITRVKLQRRAATFADVEEYAAGLVCLASDPLEWALANGSAPAMVDKLRGAFPDGRAVIDIQRHLLREEEARTQTFLQMGLPVAAANGVSHATREDRALMDVLTCVRHHTTIDEAGRLLARNSERFLKTGRQMAALFADIPQALEGARALGERLEFTLEDLGYQFPLYPVPPGETMDSFLWKRTFEGAERRYRPLHDRARRQLERELRLIEKLELAGYFLIVWDIVEFCRREGIMVQGRGSAANSAVCYSLGITAVDPVGMELLFERFLSEERGEWPDIDLDLASGEQREQAIQYVYARYGQLGAAMTANVISYRARSAVRDAGKALGFPEEQLGRLSTLIGRGDGADLEKAGLALDSPRERHLQAMVRAILDLPRHLGQHSGGMVICEGQLDCIVPLQPATMPGRVIVQWDKEDCADMGIIKVDLLGLGMMAVLKESLDLIRIHYKEEVDLALIPKDDPVVYDALQRADTIGMFQVESRAQMSCLPRMRPENFYDIVVQVAIIRPGPIVGNMLHPYLRRRQGMEAPESLHPSLDQVLKRTMGVPLFQEQLLRMAMIAANFTGGEAEDLRRAMGFKRSQKRMADVEERLRAGMTANGITGKTQDAIVQSITAFALYGFPESHAASFALLSYASAYLKEHYLAAFTAAILNNQPMGFYSPSTLVKDAQRHGLRVLPVDVTVSDWLCTIEARDGALCLRLGMNYVKGLRRAVAEALVLARPFGSIDEMKRRVPAVSKEDLYRLAELGALNKIGGSEQRHRRDAVWQASLAARPSGPLFDAGGDAPSPLAPMEDLDRLHADFRNSGLSIGAHPMQYARERLDQQGVLRAGDLWNVPSERFVRVAGLVICRQQPQTAKGFVFLSLEDETGISNIIVPPKLFAEVRTTVLQHSYLLVGGVLQNQRGAISIRARKVGPVRNAQVAVKSHDFR
ncbi:MAG: error-prone DNA polymerase [Bryobacterales bacterium]|nr:error-prone DNA polymerase [Bryobacterales bacterium]